MTTPNDIPMADVQKSDLIEMLAEDSRHLTRHDTAAAVDLIIGRIGDALRAGQRTEIRGFGTFRVRYRKARNARNPKTGATVFVPEKYTPWFKAGRPLQDHLNANRSSPSAAENG